MKSPLVSASRFAEVLPVPPRASAAWNVFALHVVESQPSALSATFSDHVITLQEFGRFRARQAVDGQAVETWCGPGCIGIIPAHLDMTWETHGTSGQSRATSIFVPDAFVSRVLLQDWDVDPRKVAIVRQFPHRDPVIESVLTALAIESQYGSPSGQLYAESACEFLAHHLIRSYSSLATPPHRVRGGLTGSRRKAVLNYIHDNLAKPIGLRELADVAGVSPRHLERAFRQAFGVPPHAYVMDTRVSAARQLLIDEPELTVEAIAQRVGMASSSHLASTFRRRLGCSPVAFRRMHTR